MDYKIVTLRDKMEIGAGPPNGSTANGEYLKKHILTV